MAYQGGRRIVGYNKRRQHKRRMYKIYERDKAERSWFHYEGKPWKRLYLSGCRKMCKQQTNRRLRKTKITEFRFKGSDYRKVFDYWWTLF